MCGMLGVQGKGDGNHLPPMSGFYSQPQSNTFRFAKEFITLWISFRNATCELITSNAKKSGSRSDLKLFKPRFQNARSILKLNNFLFPVEVVGSREH